MRFAQYTRDYENTSSDRSVAEENGAWIPHVPKVQGTLSTYENPKPSFAKTDLALPYLIHDIWENKTFDMH